jgi:N-acetylated-alpha-linked acidic dipeptidase
MLDGLTRRGTLVLGMLVTLISAAADSTGGTDSLQGFSSRTAAAEVELEQRFDSGLSAADLRAWMEQLSSAPNHVGSEHDKANAEFILRLFREWGWDASI